MPEPADPPTTAAGDAEESLPGRFSALLRDLARIPEPELGSGWLHALGPGAVVGRFEIVRELGRGGFGIVYEARDRELGRSVAFKAVRAGSPPDVREERLRREAEAVARLSHPNIVTLFDVGRSEQGPYLILELLRGRTLARDLDGGPLPPPEALRVALDVAKGVAHAHANGIVHRDLTPGNVFLCDDGQVKVLDLGMAQVFGRSRLEGGTPGYMAPEQRRGAPEDERTDVFALGVILYRMLAGELPSGPAGERGGPAALEVEGAPGLGELVARMLDEDPVARPRNGSEIVAALTPLLRGLEGTGGATVTRRARRRRGRALAAAAVAGALASGAAAAYLATRRAPGPSATRVAAALPSIAVLPFADLSPERDQAYFSEGLADEILNALGRVEGLRVPGRTSSFYYKDKGAKLADIGRELNVAAVLEGSVRKMGNRVRITAEIVRVADGLRLWGESFDRELHDVFAVQDEIAGAVVASFHVKLAGDRPSSAPLATDDPDVYQDYLIGRYHSRRFSAESMRLAVRAFERALARRPDYAPAWAGLAVPAYLVALQERTPAAVDAGRRRASAAAQKAVALAPGLSDAFTARGTLRAAIDYDWEGARVDLERAVALNGGDPDARRRHANVLATLNRLPEAIAEARKAADLDPLGGSWGKLGLLQQAAGQLEAAEASFRRGLEVWPDDVASVAGLGRNLLLAKRPKEALALFERCADEECRLWGRAAAQHALGNAAASDEALAALSARYGHTSAAELAELRAWRGEKDAAFEALDRAVAQRNAAVMWLRVDPFFAPLRGDPRFAALARRLNLPGP